MVISAQPSTLLMANYKGILSTVNNNVNPLAAEHTLTEPGGTAVHLFSYRFSPAAQFSTTVIELGL